MSDEILDNGGAASGERPTFLTVLCILTFIGSRHIPVDMKKNQA